MLDKKTKPQFFQRFSPCGRRSLGLAPAPHLLLRCVGKNKEMDDFGLVSCVVRWIQRASERGSGSARPAQTGCRDSFFRGPRRFERSPCKSLTNEVGMDHFGASPGEIWLYIYPDQDVVNLSPFPSSSNTRLMASRQLYGQFAL